MRRLAITLSALLLCGCADGAAATEKTAPEARRAATGWFGRIVPRSATPLHAPPAVFRMKGWNSRSNWTKLAELLPDGTGVEKGKEIARFEFGNEEALAWIKKRIVEAEADVESVRARVEGDRRGRDAEVAVKTLDAESAELDTAKEGLVSQRELDLYKLAARRAEEERTAAQRIARAERSAGVSELSFLEAKAADWRSGIDRYRMYEGRTRILAPHAGIVRYAYMNHLRRTVQKTDEMPSGTPFVMLAEDEKLSVEILVPEHQLGAMKPGDKVRVRAADSEERFEATVRVIEPFPQEMGFLRGDDELPDAREKAFAVTADFDAAPPAVSSGIEVRVEP